jgi:hypothetical protein
VFDFSLTATLREFFFGVFFFGEKVVGIECHLLTDCDQCATNASCGWCESTSTCAVGDLSGPEEPFGCTSWHYATCPQVGMQGIGWAFSILAFITLILSGWSGMSEDMSTHAGAVSDSEIRRAWWRNQRSAKVWHLIDVIQFTAWTGSFAPDAPTIYWNLIDSFKWSILTFSLPW